MDYNRFGLIYFAFIWSSIQMLNKFLVPCLTIFSPFAFWLRPWFPGSYILQISEVGKGVSIFFSLFSGFPNFLPVSSCANIIHYIPVSWSQPPLSSQVTRLVQGWGAHCFSHTLSSLSLFTLKITSFPCHSLQFSFLLMIPSPSFLTIAPCPP